MTDFSPAAQQVFWEFNRAASGNPYDWHYLPAIAAALRAAADQVVPDKCPPMEDFNEFDQGYAAAHITHRADLLAIAAELEGAS